MPGADSRQVAALPRQLREPRESSVAQSANDLSISPQPVGGVVSSLRGPSTLKMTSAVVKLPKGASVCAFDRSRDVVILALESSHNDDIEVMLHGNKVVTLRPGKMMLITNNESGSFDKATPLPHIGVRGVQETPLDKGFRAFTAEFSIPSAFMALKPLRNMISSANPAERKMARSILKNAAILTEITAADGPFKQSI